MSESKNISRRDWFRLKVKRENRTLGNEPAQKQTDTLQPIEHPPNHDGLDLNELPPMRQADLSQEQVEALFGDIGGLATDVQLMQRATKSSRATAQNADTTKQLELAKTALLTGHVPRVQIRYRWKDSLWIDTLAAEQGSFKLIRIAHQLA